MEEEQIVDTFGVLHRVEFDGNIYFFTIKTENGKSKNEYKILVTDGDELKEVTDNELKAKVCTLIVKRQQDLIDEYLKKNKINKGLK